MSCGKNVELGKSLTVIDKFDQSNGKLLKKVFNVMSLVGCTTFVADGQVVPTSLNSSGELDVILKVKEDLTIPKESIPCIVKHTFEVDPATITGGIPDGTNVNFILEWDAGTTTMPDIKNAPSGYAQPTPGGVVVICRTKYTWIQSGPHPAAGYYGYETNCWIISIRSIEHRVIQQEA